MPEATPPRTPPRFVPTLTERVSEAVEPTDATVPQRPVREHDAFAELASAGFPSQQRSPFFLTALDVGQPSVEGNTTTHPAQPQGTPPPTNSMASREPVSDPTSSLEANRSFTRPSAAPSFGAQPAVARFAQPAEISDRAGSVPLTAPVENQPPLHVPASASAASPVSLGTSELAIFEERLVHRVLQRVDLVMSQRLHKALYAVAQEQAIAMLPRLREEIESVVQKAVNDAFAQELPSEFKR